jgi:hypothetical protein
MRVALEAAVRIGNRHAEMFATNSMGMCLTAAGRYVEADNVQAKALAQSRAIKARRYEAVILGHSAEVALSRGLRAEALTLAREGRDISEETGPGFVGPILYGLLALVEDKRTDQESALASGEALLDQGCVGHNYFWFRRYAIERALLLEDWSEVYRHADALLLRMANEPLAYASHVAQRGHHLARRGRGDATDEAKLRLLSVAAAEIGLRIDALGSALRQI